MPIITSTKEQVNPAVTCVSHFSFENGEHMFLSLIAFDGVEAAYATFKNAGWEIPRISSRLKTIAAELEAIESSL